MDNLCAPLQRRRYSRPLDLFLRRILQDGISLHNAMGNIEEGLVSLSYDREHMGSGILLTRNGYFITAYHCVYGFDNFDLTTKMKVRTSDRSIGEVEEICSFDAAQDIALVKARLSTRFQPKHYLILDEPKENCPIIILSKWGREVRRKYGAFVGVSQEHYSSFQSEQLLHENQLIVNKSAESGDSGGLIVTANTGALIGIVSSSTSEFSTGPPFTYCGRAMTICDLIQQYRNKQRTP